MSETEVIKRDEIIHRVKTKHPLILQRRIFILINKVKSPIKREHFARVCRTNPPKHVNAVAQSPDHEENKLNVDETENMNMRTRLTSQHIAHLPAQLK